MHALIRELEFLLRGVTWPAHERKISQAKNIERVIVKDFTRRETHTNKLWNIKVCEGRVKVLENGSPLKSKDKQDTP